MCDATAEKLGGVFLFTQMSMKFLSLNALCSGKGICPFKSLDVRSVNELLEWQWD